MSSVRVRSKFKTTFMRHPFEIKCAKQIRCILSCLDLHVRFQKKARSVGKHSALVKSTEGYRKIPRDTEGERYPHMPRGTERYCNCTDEAMMVTRAIAMHRKLRACCDDCRTRCCTFSIFEFVVGLLGIMVAPRFVTTFPPPEF